MESALHVGTSLCESTMETLRIDSLIRADSGIVVSPVNQRLRRRGDSPGQKEEKVKTKDSMVDMRAYLGKRELETYDMWCCSCQRQGRDDCKAWHPNALTEWWPKRVFDQVTLQS